MRRLVAWVLVGTVVAAVGCGSASPGEGAAPAAVSVSPDFELYLVAAPPSALPRSPFDVTTAACNMGGSTIPPTEVQLVAWRGPTLGSDYLVIASLVTPELAPLHCDTRVTTATIDPIGTFHLSGRIVSSSSFVWFWTSIEVGAGPDIVVTELHGPAAADGPFSLGSTVCNQGLRPDGGFEVRFYASADATITGNLEDPTSSDVYLGSRWAYGLAPGQCDSTPVTVFPPPITGAFYLGATLGEQPPIDGEVDTSNNHTTGSLIGLGSGPDLVVSSIAGPPSASAPFPITSTVCNQGTLPSPAAEVRLYASADATITGTLEDPASPDVLLGARAVASLAPRTCDTAAVTVSPPPGTGAFTLGAIVDEGDAVHELIESNNRAAGSRIGLGSGPDLVVTSVAGPPSASAPFAITATVCNQGTQPSPGTDVRFYASADAAITGTLESPAAPDIFLGARTVVALSPGQCDVGSADAVPPPVTGAFILGAIVDEAGAVDELIEANNHVTGPVIGLGNGPDLVITEIARRPSGFLRYTVTATVCNQGTQAAYGSEVRLYASIDRTITGTAEAPLSPDTFLGQRAVDALAPGQCDTGAIDFFPPSILGEFVLGAIVDEINAVGELNEANNHTAGPMIGFGWGPDLVVTQVVGPASASGPFAITSTVCNQGVPASPSFEIRFYASADATITGVSESPFTSDVLLGARSVASLEPGQCDTRSTGVASPGPGVFTLGAIADEGDAVHELVESNNHATGSQIGIGDGPDLVVTQVSGPASASAPFAIASTVCNQGTRPSPAAELRFYASADTAITGVSESPSSPDSLLGARAVSPLAPGQCDTRSADVAPAPHRGAFYLGAIIDETDLVHELIESNNRATGPLIGLGDGPDLVVTSVSGPASASAAFAIASTVCNQGTGPSPAADVRFYASADTTITGSVESPLFSDRLLGARTVGPLAPGQCDTGSAIASPPPATGAFTLGAIVDEAGAIDELIESNNHTTGSLIGLGDGPDLVVTQISAPALAAGHFVIDATVCNQGTRPNAFSSFTVRFYAAREPAATHDVLLGARDVGVLQPGQCDTSSTDVFYTPDAGAFTLVAVADADGTVDELIESNNRTIGAPIGFGYGPDLVITTLSGPASASGPFAIASTVCNQGNQPSAATDVRFYASPGPTTGDPPSPGVLLGARPVAPLQPGQCDANSATLVQPPGLGVFTLGAIVDEGRAVDEVLEANNRAIGSVIAIGSGPDLVVTQVSGPASASAPFAVSSTVCNQGTQASPGAVVRLYASADATITGTLEVPGSPDGYLGSRTVDALAPGQCDSRATGVDPPPATGAFRLGAIVDEARTVDDLNESNNHTTGTLIGLGNGPDLVVASVSGPASASGAFAIAVTVCNQGTLPSPGTVVRFYASADPTITGTAESPVSPDVLLGARAVPPLPPGQCDTGAADASAGPERIALYLGAIVDETGEVNELIESNNRTTGARIVFGYAPDMVITSISGPPSTSTSGSFDVTATVCNQGTAPSFGAAVRFYASYDLTIVGIGENPNLEDIYLGYGEVGPLDPGQCETLTTATEFFGQLVPGLLYLGATVNEGGGADELLASNNHLTGAQIAFVAGPAP